MFEDRLWSLRKNSEHFNRILGQRQIREKDLHLIGQEVATRYGYTVVYDPINDPAIPWDESHGTSFVTRDPAYVISYCTSGHRERDWFCLAHEYAHILLHHHCLTIDFEDKRHGIEEEAHFFGQLCFWPINWIFSPDYAASFISQTEDLEWQTKGITEFQPMDENSEAVPLPGPPVAMDEEKMIELLVDY